MKNPVFVVKSDAPHQRIVMGEVYAPNRPDSDGEFMTAEEIQKMAHDFVRQQRMDQIDQEHQNETTDGITVVESFIARKGDPDFIPGSWVVAVHIPDDETWNKVLKGEINGFSMEALVNREDQEREIEMDDVVTGRTTTTKGDGAHEHTFGVKYGPNGEFLGGRTTKAEDGHYHLIRRGTHTEEANGHIHTFSSVDTVKIL
jgi:hypothetical protein